MSSDRAYRLSPAAARQRGLPPLGIELTAPPAVVVTPIDHGELVVVCREDRTHGKPLGELSVSLFAATLIMDRDGVLEATARTATAQLDVAMDVTACVAVTLGSISGYRVAAHVRGRVPPPLPYANVFALASDDMRINGGVLIAVRTARLDWPAGEQMLASLVVTGRRPTTSPMGA